MKNQKQNKYLENWPDESEEITCLTESLRVIIAVVQQLAQTLYKPSTELQVT
jgi:hypothetical protein